MKANLKYSKKRLSEGSSPYASGFEGFVERVDEVSTKDELEKLYDEVNAYGFNMSDLHYLTYLIFKKMKSLEESLNEDIHEESLKEERKQMASNKKSFKNIKTINNIKIGDNVINSNRPKDYGVMEVLDIRQVDKEYRNQLGSLKETEVVLYSPKERRKFFIPQGEFIMNYRKECNESLNEDLFDKPRNIADSICKYLDSKNFYNYELVDYDAYPMNTSKITFEVDGDWKHDHWRFKDLVYDWSFDNNKSIYKMESELVRDDGSDNYASDYFIYVTENEDSLNALKSMSKLFSEGYEDDVDNWQYLDTDQDYKPQKDYFADIETTDDDGPYYKLCSYSSYPSAGINGDSFDTYEIVKAFDAKDAQEKFIDLLDDEDKEVLRYFNNDFRAFMKDRNLYIDDATKKEYDSFHGLGEEPGELSRRFKKYLNKEESLKEGSSSKNIISNIESKLFSIIKKYFHDGNYSHTQGIKITESNYDLLRYTARPYSGYRGTSSKLIMDDDGHSMSEFKSEVRKYLKQFGVTKIKFDTKKLKLHYGYVSGPDDFPVICLNAIYFNDINNSVDESLSENNNVIDFLKKIKFGDEFDFKEVGDWGISAWTSRPLLNFSNGFYIVQLDNDKLNKHFVIPDNETEDEFMHNRDSFIKRHFNDLNESVKGMQRANRKTGSLKESSYGGAFDIEDDQFFTRDDINEFGYDIADQFSAWADSTFDLSDVYMDTPTKLHLEVLNSEDYEEYGADIKIDMRRIRSPKDLYRYEDEVLRQLKDAYFEYHAEDEMEI